MNGFFVGPRGHLQPRQYFHLESQALSAQQLTKVLLDHIEVVFARAATKAVTLETQQTLQADLGQESVGAPDHTIDELALDLGELEQSVVIKRVALLEENGNALSDLLLIEDLVKAQLLCHTCLPVLHQVVVRSDGTCPAFQQVEKLTHADQVLVVVIVHEYTVLGEAQLLEMAILHEANLTRRRTEAEVHLDGRELDVFLLSQLLLARLLLVSQHEQVFVDPLGCLSNAWVPAGRRVAHEVVEDAVDSTEACHLLLLGQVLELLLERRHFALLLAVVTVATSASVLTLRLVSQAGRSLVVVDIAAEETEQSKVLDDCIARVFNRRLLIFSRLLYLLLFFFKVESFHAENDFDFVV